MKTLRDLTRKLVLSTLSESAKPQRLVYKKDGPRKGPGKAGKKRKKPMGPKKRAELKAEEEEKKAREEERRREEDLAKKEEEERLAEEARERMAQVEGLEEEINDAEAELYELRGRHETRRQDDMAKFKALRRELSQKAEDGLSEDDVSAIRTRIGEIQEATRQGIETDNYLEITGTDIQDWIETIAVRYGTTLEAIKDANPDIKFVSSSKHGGKHWVHEGVTLRIPQESLIHVGEEDLSAGMNIFTNEMEQKRAQAIHESESETFAAEKRERTQLEETREKLIDVKDVQARQRALRGLNLARTSNIDVRDDAMVALFRKARFEKWQKEWENVSGRHQVEALFEANSGTLFQEIGFNLGDYQEAIKKGMLGKLNFTHLMNAAYAKMPGANRFTYIEAYTGALRKLTLKQPERSYNARTGTVRIKIQKTGDKETYGFMTLPLKDAIEVDPTHYEIRDDGTVINLWANFRNLENPKPMTPAQIDRMVKNPGSKRNFYVSPEGGIMNSDGEVIYAAEDNPLAILFLEERAELTRLEQLYQDVSDLYHLTGQLEYEEQGDRAQERIMVDEALPLQARLGEVFMTKKAAKQTRRYRGLLPLKKAKNDQVTYTDIESGKSYSVRKEDIYQYYAGEGVMADVLDTYITYDKESKEYVFNEKDALEFVNGLMKAALLEKMLKEMDRALPEDPDARQTAIDKLIADRDKQFTNKGLEMTNFNTPFTKEQTALFKDGYLRFAIMRHGSEIAEADEAREQLSETVEESYMRMDAEMVGNLTDSLLAQGILKEENVPEFQKRMLGVAIHFVHTRDSGLKHISELYRVNPDGSEELILHNEHTYRTASETLKPRQIGTGLRLLNVEIPGSPASISLDAGGAINLQAIEGSAIGVQPGFAIHIAGGIKMGINAGVAARATGEVGGSVGWRADVPLGPVKLGADVRFGTGFAMVGLDLGHNVEGDYELRRAKLFENYGFDEIEALIDSGADKAKIVEAILGSEKYPAFGGLRPLFDELNAASQNNIFSDAAFNQFVIDLYGAVRHSVSADALDKASKAFGAIPTFPSEIGIKMLIIPGPTGAILIPVPYIGITLGTTKLVYRTTSGLNYEQLSDARILAEFDREWRAGKASFYETVHMGNLPRITTDPETGLPIYLQESDAYEGSLATNQHLAAMNAKLEEIDIELTPEEVAENRVLLEIDVKDVDGHLRYVMDEDLKSRGAELIYEGGRAFLSYPPGENICFKRQNIYFPFKKEGAFEQTVVAISDNPYISIDHLLNVRRCATVEMRFGKNAYEDATHSHDRDSNLIRSLAEFRAEPGMFSGAWKNLLEIDALQREHLEILGHTEFKEVGDQEEMLRVTAESLMSRTNSPDAKFRVDFKRYSIGGENYNEAALNRICTLKATEALKAAGIDRAPTARELQYFKQVLNIYSFIDIHGEGTEAELKKQKATYERMLENFMRPQLEKMFGKLKVNGVSAFSRFRTKEMASYVIDRLRIDDWEDFRGEALLKMEPGSVFASIAGTEGMNGPRISEDYREDDLYKVLSLVDFDMNSNDKIERDVSWAILQMLNPLPEKMDLPDRISDASEVSDEQLKKVSTFLKDDFSMRLSLVWYHADEWGAQRIRDLMVAARDEDPETLRNKLEWSANTRALEDFERFTRYAREVETARYTGLGARRVELGNGYYLSFADVSTSFGVFQRCGNVSMFLKERMMVENEMGQVIAIEDDTHKMVAPQNAIRQHKLFAAATVTVEDKGRRVYNRNTMEEPPPEESGGTNEGAGVQIGDQVKEWADDAQDSPGDGSTF